MKIPLNIASGYLCDGCGDVVDGTRPGYTRVCSRCLMGEQPPPRRWKPPLTAATGPDPDTPEEIDMVAEGWELVDG